MFEGWEGSSTAADSLARAHLPVILAIDPGTTESGWCLLRPNGGRIDAGVSSNTDLLAGLAYMPADVMAIEVFEARGMPIGQESIETIIYTGRLMQAWGHSVRRVKRSEVKRHLCGSLRAKDGNVRQALIDLYGGKDAAVGRKATPGPLYGIASHAWAALAVAVTARDATACAIALSGRSGVLTGGQGYDRDSRCKATTSTDSV